MSLHNKDVYTGVQQVIRFSDRGIPVRVALMVGESLVRLREQFDVIEACRTKVVKAHQQKNGDGTLMTKLGTDGLGREIKVPVFDDDDAVDKELDELQSEECEVEVHSMDTEKFIELMEKKKCKECGEPSEVSSNEMAALIKLGILT